MIPHLRGAIVEIVGIKSGTVKPLIHAGYMAKQNNPKYAEGLNQPKFISVPKTFCATQSEHMSIVAKNGKFKVTCKKCQAKLSDDSAYNTETEEYSITDGIQNYRKPITELMKKKPKAVA